MADEFLSVDQVAGLFNRDVATIRRWCENDRFPGARKLNSRVKRSPWLIPQGDVQAEARRLAEKSVSRN